MVKVKFRPSQAEVTVPAETNLLQVADIAGVPVEGTCGGKGSCGKCKVKVIAGHYHAPSALELKHLTTKELQAGIVLACRHKVLENMVILTQEQKDLPQRKISLQITASEVEIDPSVDKVLVNMNPPTIKDQLPDCERLLNSLPRQEIKINRGVLSALPETLRDAKFSVTAVLAGKRLLTVEPGNTTGSLFGLAFDIGTTTIAGSLLNLLTGEIVATAAVTNPQNVYGADVISRITHAGKTGGLQQLQNKVVVAINSIIRLLLKKSTLSPEHLYETVLVGNTTMSHLFLGINPTWLASAPFIPVYSQPIKVSAAELGLEMNPAGRVLVLPNIAGHVGSDTVGMILATRLEQGLEQPKKISLAVDFGTNGELVLAGKGRILACSTAAGPAFEGAQIACGMRATEGAIEAVTINKEAIRVKVIGKVLPRGICGSGLVDVAAELLKAGMMDYTGRLTTSEFVLVPKKHSATGEDIVITQKDLRELQLAKGAIYAGTKILLKELGIREEDISEVFLAGAFGNYIRQESALTIGLLPNLPIHQIISVGNAAGNGAILALISKKERARAFSLAKRVEHVELSGRADFQDEFVNALLFKL